MKWSTLALGITIIGVLGVAALLLFQRLTTTNENDYYLLKEGTRAAMLEALDREYYNETGELKIDDKIFVEMFLRRYAESNTTIGNKTTITFYDIMNEPPKVTVVIDTGTNDKVYDETVTANVENYLSAILEIPVHKSGTSELTKKYSYINATGNNLNSKEFKLNIPDELKSMNSNGYIYADSIKISNIEVNRVDYKIEEILKEVAAQKLYYDGDDNIMSINNLNISSLKNATGGTVEKGTCNNCIKITVPNDQKINYTVTWSYNHAT